MVCFFNKAIQDLNLNYACFFFSFKKLLLLLLLLGCARSNFDWPITKKKYWNIRHAPKSIVLVPQVQDASLWGKLIWMIAHIINYCCSLSFSHSFSSFSCVLVGSEIPYTSIPSFLFCSPITTYFA